jgi:hypothetical protein
MALIFFSVSPLFTSFYFHVFHATFFSIFIFRFHDARRRHAVYFPDADAATLLIFIAFAFSTHAAPRHTPVRRHAGRSIVTQQRDALRAVRRRVRAAPMRACAAPLFHDAITF